LAKMHEVFLPPVQYA